jgi:hypothetical protein
MGAIVAATLGYEATFALASVIFILFIAFLIYFIPWSCSLRTRTGGKPGKWISRECLR